MYVICLLAFLVGSCTPAELAIAEGITGEALIIEEDLKKGPPKLQPPPVVAPIPVPAQNQMPALQQPQNLGVDSNV